MESRNQIGHAPHAAQPALSVMPPKQHDGVGNALRAAFDANMLSLPDDMKNLLARLG